MKASARRGGWGGSRSLQGGSAGRQVGLPNDKCRRSKIILSTTGLTPMSVASLDRCLIITRLQQLHGYHRFLDRFLQLVSGLRSIRSFGPFRMHYEGADLIVLLTKPFTNVLQALRSMPVHRNVDPMTQPSFDLVVRNARVATASDCFDSRHRHPGRAHRDARPAAGCRRRARSTPPAASSRPAASMRIATSTNRWPRRCAWPTTSTPARARRRAAAPPP